MRVAPDESRDDAPHGPSLDEHARRASDALTRLRVGVGLIEANSLEGVPDATDDDVQIVATIRILTSVIETMREFGISTSALNDINAELLNLYRGGKSSPLLQPRRGRGPPNQHVDQDLRREHLAAAVDYLHGAFDWPEQQASDWVYHHVPENVRSSEKLRPKTLEEWRRRFRRDTGRDGDAVGRIAFVNQRDRLARDKPNIVQIRASMRDWFGTAPRRQPE